MEIRRDDRSCVGNVGIYFHRFPSLLTIERRTLYQRFPPLQLLFYVDSLQYSTHQCRVDNQTRAGGVGFTRDNRNKQRVFYKFYS